MTAPTLEPTTAPPVRRRLPSLPSHAWWLIGPVAAALAVLVGLVIAAIPSLAAWATSTSATTSWSMPARVTGLAWLATHDVTLSVGTATYSLLPWGLLLVWGWLCVTAGRWAARAGAVTTIRRAALVSATIAACYAAAMALVSTLTAGPEVHTAPARAFGIGLAFAFVTAGWGTLHGAGLLAEVWARVPQTLQATVRAAAGGVLALLGFGAALLALGLALNWGQILDIQVFLGAGFVGGLVLFVVTLGYLPVAVMWSVSYLLGAGLGLGGATVISPFVSSPLPTQLPPLVYFAALPQGSTPVAWALPVLGVAAGVIVGLLVARSVRAGALMRMAAAVGASLLGALVIAILARMSYGSLGDVRLVHLGPSSQLVALLTLITLLIGSVPSALAFRRAATSASDDVDELDAARSDADG